MAESEPIDSSEPAPESGEPGDEENAVFEPTKKEKKSPILPWIIAGLVFAVSLPIYYHVSLKRAAIFNTDTQRTSFMDSTDTEKVKVHVIFHHDQHVYLNIGRLLKIHNYDYFVVRQRTPGYPLIMSLLYQHDDRYEFLGEKKDPRRISDEMFSRGRHFNIILSMVCLLVIFLFSVRYIGVYESLFVTWITGWTVFLFKGIYVQPEILFYTLLLITFVLLWKQITKPTWGRGIVAGLLLAITYFVKSAVLPLLLLFVVCFATKRIAEFLATFRLSQRSQLTWSGWFKDIMKGVIIPVIFVALLSPYFFETWKAYGSPLWSVHSKHLMWQEDESTKKKWRVLSDPEIEIPADAPTMKKYFAEHSLAEIIKRPIDGASSSLGRISREFRDAYRLASRRIMRVCILIGLLFFIPVIKSLKSRWVEFLYVIGYFAGYGILYGWYEVIGAGPRMLLSLYPALLFVMMNFLHHFSGTFTIPKLGWKVPMKPISLLIIAICFAISIHHILGSGEEALAWTVEGGS